MARARNIKPGFFDNEILGELPALTRLLFIGLWCLADREGRLQDRPKRIKKALLGYDDVTAEDVDQMLQQLSDNNFITRYIVGEEQYIQITNFLKHQNPHCKEQASVIPGPDESLENTEKDKNTVHAQCKHDTETVVAGLIPDSLKLIPDTLNNLSCADEQAHGERGPADNGDGLTVGDDTVKGRVASDSDMAAVREHQAVEKAEGGTQEAPEEKGKKRLKSPDWKTAKTAMEKRFCRFWDEYPNERNTGKYPCWEKFQKLRVDDELLERMLNSLRISKQSPQWNRSGGQYIPMPLTWLNQHRWEDNADTEGVETHEPAGNTAGSYTAGFKTQADY